MCKDDIICSNCEELYPADCVIQLNNGDYICEDCELEDFFYCDECDELRHRDEMKLYKNLGVILCENCGTEIPR